MFGKDGLLDELKKALSERILYTKLDQHLEAKKVGGQFNYRNRYRDSNLQPSLFA